MPGTRKLDISKRTVDRLSVGEREVIYWDRNLPGFGVRVYPSGAKVYVVQSRENGRSRRVTLGRHGTLSPKDSRRQAARIIARLKGWEDPEPEPAASATVADAAMWYLREHVAVHCKPRTQALYRTVIDRHLVPTLGDTTVGEVKREEVSALHHRLRNTPHAANRAVDVLGQILEMADVRGWRPRRIGNPCRSIEKYPERQHERFLSDDEFRRLGRVLEEAAAGAAGASPAAVAAIRLLLLTGCRRSEVLGLRWEHVDLDARELRLPDTKTGAFFLPVPVSSVQCHTVPN
ncbi:MAG: integrase arm-type DNA-binding domain-containing protein [Immundisolibacterales bacterium]|nr:integrase arm-type DNA-binding domain-containing protein [Immundisolibacterales bacterium]